MSIDIGKLKSTLEQSHITIVDYYIVDEKCGMLKCFMYKINQFILIYIPTKMRTELQNKKNMYELKLFEDVIDEEDYAKYDEYQINFLNQRENDAYKNLSQKYNKNISTNGDGNEPIEKRMMRQIKRLNIPFTKLNYTIGIQNKKILTLHFGEEINTYYIRNLTSDIRCYMYIVNVKDLIDNISEFSYELETINKQFYTMIYDIILSNFDEISNLTKESNKSIIDRFSKQSESYQKKSIASIQLIKALEVDEKTEIKKYKVLFQEETSTIKKNTLESQYQKILKTISQKRVEKIDAIIEQTYVYHIYFLLLEEISFDNFVMLKRVYTNTEKLKTLFM